jgi:hypothetical protein
MTQEQAQQLGHGVYELYWKDGSSSVAAVGSLHDGTRWFAPINWTSKDAAGIASAKWRLVDHVRRI